jgi:SAM-dependent MidA family methyltransferase
VFIDYGFDEATYYHPQRNQGTLRCHHRHRAGDQPLVWPGLQDVTAHVNFDALTEVAAEAGLEGGHVPMAQFLLDAGILEVLSQVSPDDAARPCNHLFALADLQPRHDAPPAGDR